MDHRHIVVIAASRGSFRVLKSLVAGLKPEFSATVCIVLHIGRHDSVLPDLLSSWGALPARHPADGEVISPSTVYVAPPDRHMVLEEGRLWLTEAAAENFARPAADPLFRSAALEYGQRVVGVVLSGDLDDGAAGLASVRAHGGYCIVQNPNDAEAPSMPRAALDATGADALATERTLPQCITAAVEGAARRQGTLRC
jgi:two-component system chemotaxis response regulator CheB